VVDLSSFVNRILFLCKLILTYFFSDPILATEKLLARSSQTTTSTENKAKSAGGKDGDENKSSESTTVERKSTVSGDIDEHLRLKGVVAIDMKYYAEWKVVLRSATDRYAAVLDQIEKNKEKITKPRGGNPGGAAMSMF